MAPTTRKNTPRLRDGVMKRGHYLVGFVNLIHLPSTTASGMSRSAASVPPARRSWRTRATRSSPTPQRSLVSSRHV
jgi:hypothetical protein